MSNFNSVKTQIQSLINSANAKTGKSDANLTDGVNSLIDGYGVGGLEPVENEWNQIPTLVKNYLDNVTYDPSDYTVSHIAEYAPSTVDQNNTYPIGKSIETSNGILDRNGYEMSVSNGNTTVYNDIPNKYTEYTVRNNGSVSQVGTLKPTGFLRQIKCATSNVRDLGGWACDGGIVKYGKMFRGGEFKETDLDVFLNQLNIRHELNLRGKSEAEKVTTILKDYVGFTCPQNYVWYSISDTDTWKEIIRCVFDCAIENKPLFFHCSAGADRTGTVACIIEAILGVSQSDIDKDYELTCFAFGVSTDDLARRRNESEWSNLINAINTLTVGSTFRDKVLNWIASMGFTVDEINAFRSAMTDGTPDTITLDIDSYSVANTLTNVTSDNEDTTVVQYQPYEAKISVPTGYVIEDISVTMGGVDITSSVFSGSKTNLNRAINKNLTNCTIDGKNAVINGQDYVATLTAKTGYTLDSVIITIGGVDMSTYYSDGKIAIPNVTGDIEITAVAVVSVPAYTNLADTSSDDWQTDYRINSSGNVVALEGHTVTNYIPCAKGDILRFKGFDVKEADNGKIQMFNSSKSSVSICIGNQSYNSTVTQIKDKITEDANGVFSWTVGTYGDDTVISDSKGVAYVRLSGVVTDNLEDVIITVNEEIE